MFESRRGFRGFLAVKDPKPGLHKSLRAGGFGLPQDLKAQIFDNFPIAFGNQTFFKTTLKTLGFASLLHSRFAFIGCNRLKKNTLPCATRL
jgi:hypothetical protein